jgi:hypothetical protein
MDGTERISLLYNCSCGWKRYITDTAEWRFTTIIHPIYGLTNQINAARLDVSMHSCIQHVWAQHKSPRGKAERKVNYGRYQEKKVAEAA